MKNTKCLIITCGFFGDIIFASSIAEKLKDIYAKVDYLIGFPQIYQLLKNNPYINDVFISDIPGPYPIFGIDQTEYDKVIKLDTLNYLVTPCEEFQQQAGIETPTPEYEVYTTPEYDDVAEKLIMELQETYSKPVIGIMSNWEPKTYIFTKEQYEAGIDVPNLGYGGSHRNVQYIVNELNKDFTLIPIGVGDLNQQQTISIADNDVKSLLFEASILKYCDVFVGTDGGLATIAAGVGTKTIITGDFNLQLYGWNGVLKKINNPRLGPKEYFGDYHVVLDPFLTDEEVIQQLKTIIK